MARKKKKMSKNEFVRLALEQERIPWAALERRGVCASDVLQAAAQAGDSEMVKRARARIRRGGC